jgi:hypothetical protein
MFVCSCTYMIKDRNYQSTLYHHLHLNTTYISPRSLYTKVFWQTETSFSIFLSYLKHQVNENCSSVNLKFTNFFTPHKILWYTISIRHRCAQYAGHSVYEGGPKNNRNRPVAHACFLVTSCAAR